MPRTFSPIAGLLLALLSLSAPCAAPTSIDARPFPRQYTASGTPFTVYQPQMESWEGNRLRGRFAVSVKSGVETGADGKTVDSLDYGVVWFSALTEVDKEAREVVLRNASFDRASFPTAISSQDKYLGLVRSVVREGATFTIDLDQLESALAVSQWEKKPASLPVKNVPPEILIAFFKAWDEIAAEESAKNPFFKKVLESQRAYASKVVPAKRFMFPPYSFAANYYWPEE